MSMTRLNLPEIPAECGRERLKSFAATPRCFCIFAIGMALLVGGCSVGSAPAPVTALNAPTQALVAPDSGRHRGTPTPAPTATPTGSPSGPAEVPYQADLFVNSIGLNTHFAGGGNWTTIFNTAKADLTSLGVRHIRDGWSGAGDTTFNTEMKTLASDGIHANLITYYGETAADMQSIAAAVTPALESYEAPNEYDCSGDTNWVSDLTTQLHTLYGAVGGKTLPVYGPSMCGAGAYSSLGDVHTYMDDGNMHNYMGGYNPGTTGYGGQFAFCGSVFFYGSIDFNLGCAEQVSGALSFTQSIAFPNPGSGSTFDFYTTKTGSKPVVTTENGYNTYPSTIGSVDATTQGKYLPRLFLMQYASGIPRTYWYELIDDATPCVSASACFGLTDVTGSVPKPSFYALEGLTSALANPGLSFVTTPLLYGISGAPSTLAHMLFQKRNGQYILALWNETSSWNVNSGTGARITVRAVSTTVKLPFAPSALSVKAFNDAGILATVAPAVAGNNVTFNIDDHVCLMTFSHT
jgi:hypothetical protein